MENDLWAKLGPLPDDGSPRLWLSLVDHSADVAAVFEAMIGLETVGRRLARLAGVPRLPAEWRVRLAALVALHDFGKANRGFQSRSDLRPRQRVGHVLPGLAVLTVRSMLGDRARAALGIEAWSGWGSELAICSAMLSVAAHHGRPVAISKAQSEFRDRLNVLWSAGADDDPIAALATLGVVVRSWFPSAFETGGAPLPEAPPFWHAVAGLVMLADWIGSDQAVFPLYVGPQGDRMARARQMAPGLLTELGLDPAPKRASLPRVSFNSICAYAPREIQKAVGEAQGQVVILEAETGSGKTEAALYRFARLFELGEIDGLYFALPTRVAAKSLYDRVRIAVERMFPAAARPPVILAVPGYARADGVTCRVLPGFDVQWDDDPDGSSKRGRWAAEHPKRFLAGTIAVGTIDQALLGAIQVRHAHMRSASLLRHLLVVDEVHASDVYMERLLTSLLSQHTRAGGHALLLSATLGSAARMRLLGLQDAAPIPLQEAEALAYPAISSSADTVPREKTGSGRVKSVAMSLDARIGEPDAVAQLALAAAKHGAKVLVVRNLHRTAVATAEALFALAPDHPAFFRCNGVPTLHHGRFAREDRELLDGVIEQQMKEDRGRKGLVLIGTQTLEQSLDICADFLITDLCPADVLLQRIGRLHRHAENARSTGFEEPQAIVLAPASLEPLLLRADYGLGGEHGPYRDLVILEATRRLIIEFGQWQIPDMNRLLVERATHPEALDALTAELARSNRAWEKSRQTSTGNALGDLQTAIHAALDWRRPWIGPGDRELAFLEDERLTTRLGTADLLVQLPLGTEGPFKSSIRTLTVPSFWLNGIDANGDVEPKDIDSRAGRLTFSIQGRKFAYDKLGLHRA